MKFTALKERDPTVTDWQLAIGHFLTNFAILAKQILFARTHSLYIFNGEVIESL